MKPCLQDFGNGEAIERKMIYCIEDDQNIRDLILYTLKSSGFDVLGFESAPSFWKEIKEADGTHFPELILLDIMLPGEDGLEILAHLKQDGRLSRIPVILVTAKGSEYDKVRGLDEGADDYIVKPFGMMELISRVKALLRRTGANNRSGSQAQDEILSCGAVKMDVLRHNVFAGEDEVVLTYKEFELLKALLEADGNVLSRDLLLTKIWGYDFDGETRTVDVHIGTLRQKMGAAGEMIETVRGIGYRVEGRKNDSGDRA